MRHAWFARAGLVGLLALTLACGNDPAPVVAEPGARTPGRTIVLGDVASPISNQVTNKLKRFQPLADYLAARLGAFGIGEGLVKIAPDLNTMAAWLRLGEVDFYFDSLYPAMRVIDTSGAEPMLRRWKGGDPEYHTVFFTRVDSGIRSLGDLRGQAIAFDDAASTSGYMLPLVHLIQAGFDPVETTFEASGIGADQVGYIYTGDDDNTIQWVISGHAIAGAVDSQTFRDIADDDLAGIRVLARTANVPRQIVVVRPGMDPELHATVRSLLSTLDETLEGPAVLTTLKTARFDEFPNGPEVELARMRELHELIRDR